METIENGLDRKGAWQPTITNQERKKEKKNKNKDTDIPHKQILKEIQRRGLQVEDKQSQLEPQGRLESKGNDTRISHAQPVLTTQEDNSVMRDTRQMCAEAG